MVWLQAFPQPNTNVSNVGQTQDNWLFLQNNINTDHYFNVNNFQEGHHKFVQVSNIATPGVAAGMDAVLYGQAVGPSGTYPFWRGAIQGISEIPTAITGHTVLPAPTAFGELFTFVGRQASSGILNVYLQGNLAINASAFIVWDGTNTAISQFALNPPVANQIAIVGGAGAIALAILISETGTYFWNYTSLPPN